MSRHNTVPSSSFTTRLRKRAAKASKDGLAASGKYRYPIVTEILPAPDFWRDEDYHQQYLEKRGLAHCRL